MIYEGFKTFGDLKAGDRICVLDTNFMSKIYGTLDIKPGITGLGFTLNVNNGRVVTFDHLRDKSVFSQSIIDDKEGHLFGTSLEVLKKHYSEILEKEIKLSTRKLDMLNKL